MSLWDLRVAIEQAISVQAVVLLLIAVVLFAVASHLRHKR